MKKTISFLLFFIIVMAAIIFTGCDLLTEYIPEEDLKISYSRHAGDYLYSDKVHLHLSDRYDDSLKLISGSYTIETVLEDTFIYVAHQNNLLIIEVKDAYYVFDIDSYKPPEEETVMYITPNGATVTENVELCYDMQKYSVDDFKKIFPSYENYNWFNF